MPGLEGTSLGRYRLERRLGKGGMAEVYLATDERMNREVAVKVVSSNQTEFTERFAREANAQGKMQQEHILSAYDYGVQEPWHYLVMPYIPHGTLSDRLKKGPLSLEHAGELLQQMAGALQYAHQRGFIHRDIKPSNILLRDDHYAYLADFGLARLVEEGGELTQTGTLLGTPEYMAPELADGPASKSSDIYALAIVLYQMLTGRVPFQGDSAISVFWKQVRDMPRPASQYNPNIPASVDRVLSRALEKDPELRYPSALALSQAYQDAITKRPGRSSAAYDTEAIVEKAAQPARPLTPVIPPLPEKQPAGEPQRIVLPGNSSPTRPPLPVSGRSRPPVTPMPEAELPFDQATDVMTPGSTTVRNLPPQPPRRRRRSNQALGGVLIGLAFILVVSGLFIFLVNHSGQQKTGTGTVTSQSGTADAQAAATSSVIQTQTAQAQQVQATQQAQQAQATAAAATATAQAQATVTAITANATAITGKQPLVNDPLTKADDNWPNNSICSFANNTYTISLTAANTLHPCISGNLQYGDAAIQVDLTLTSANNAGIMLRASADATGFYDFEITKDGKYFFRYYQNSKYTYLINNTASQAIQADGQKNTLLVIANGDDFQLFINGSFINEVHDGTFATGHLGLDAGVLDATQGAASFTNLNVYKV